MNTPDYPQHTPSEARMQTMTECLDSRHSFSFGGHLDPERMGFGPLRVVNEDRVAPGQGFPPHPHRDMEIISLVLSGQLAHRDSLGNGRVIQAGDLQYMSAGTGVVHSEYNPSATEPVHFLQIWIEPEARGLAPRYADQAATVEGGDRWTRLLSPDSREGSIAIRQDVFLSAARLSAGAEIGYTPEGPGRGLWIYVIEGRVVVGGQALDTGDSLALAPAEAIRIQNLDTEPSRVLLFDLIPSMNFFWPYS